MAEFSNYLTGKASTNGKSTNLDPDNP